MPASCNWSVRPNQAVFLTYSQANDLTIDDLQAFFDSIGADYHVVGHELHGDGGHHYHCLVHFGDIQRWRDARVFDVKGVHPNVDFAKAKGSVSRIYAYCTKDGDWYASEEAQEFFDALAEESTAKQSKNDIWEEILSSPDAASFWAACRRLAPYDLGTRYSSLEAYVVAHYNKTTYVAPDVTWAPSETMDDMNEWVDQFLVCVGVGHC